MPKKAIIFDFDGTIADTFHLAHQVYNKLSKEFGYRPLDKDEALNMRNKSFQEFVQYLNIPILKIPLIAMRARHEMHRDISQAKPVTGLSQVLHEIHNRGYTLGILTSNSRKNVNSFLTEHNLEIFDFVATTINAWIKESRLKSILWKRRWQPNEVLYVGDSSIDVDTAHGCKVEIAAVTWGYNSRAALESHGAEYVLDKPQQLLERCPRITANSGQGQANSNIVE